MNLIILHHHFGSKNVVGVVRLSTFSAYDIQEHFVVFVSMDEFTLKLALF